MTPRPLTQWIFGAAIAVFMTAAPFFYYRANYTTHKRLRVVEDGRVYRSGCMTADGFEEAIRRYGIRTVINLQEEAEDPDLPKSYLNPMSEKESELCRRLGVRYELLFVDLKMPNTDAPPDSFARFYQLMDDQDIYPVLIHCRAGLHRTGCIVALYRMEYNGWTRNEALAELRGNGFGLSASYANNEYIEQYILSYQRRSRETPARLTSRPVERR